MSKRKSEAAGAAAKRSKAPTAEDLVGEEAQTLPFATIENNIDKALCDLRKQDTDLAPLIDAMKNRGGCLWSPEGRRADGSVDSIHQFCCLLETRLRAQISVKEANTLLDDVKLACADQVTPASIVEHASALEELILPKRRGQSKHDALQELAKYWVDATPDFAAVASSEVRSSLLKIKGIGDATVLTFLVKALARPDVLVESDGLMRKWLKSKKHIADGDKNELKSARVQAAAAWKPWRSVAYLLICEAKNKEAKNKPGASTRVGVASVLA